jgi:hypothetical protein
VFNLWLNVRSAEKKLCFRKRHYGCHLLQAQNIGQSHTGVRSAEVMGLFHKAFLNTQKDSRFHQAMPDQNHAGRVEALGSCTGTDSR